MQRTPTILAFAGSVRKQSLNIRLLDIGVQAVRAAGAEVTLIDLRDFALPIYDSDLEADVGVPDNAKRLRELMMKHDGMLIASPEYNGSVSGLLKNTLDWCSRPAGDGDALAPYRGKIVGMMAASPSPFGGVRGLIALRSILAKMGAIAVPDDVCLPSAHLVMEVDANTQAMIALLAGNLVALASAARRP